MADPGKTMGYEQATGTELSGSKYMVAQGKNKFAGDWADNPAEGTSIHFDRDGRRPYQVYIAADRGGTMKFKFNTTDGYVDFGDPVNLLGKTLEITPIAWSGSHADSATGDVIFMYRGEQ